MRAAYRVLAYLVAAGVVVQAMAMVFATAGLFKWIEGGGQLYKAVTESDETLFPEEVGFAIHAMNGAMIVPAIALLLLICSFFARIPGGVKWAALVFLLVVVQVFLGFSGFAIPALGAVHGLNALLLFTAAIYAARRQRDVAAKPADVAAEPEERLATPA
jgi:heme A synthase